MKELQIISRDKEGFLQCAEEWSETICSALAQECNMQLTTEHWELIKLLRKFYHKHGIHPTARALIKLIAQELGSDKGNSLYLLKLFPNQSVKTLSLLAGLPKPPFCF